MIPTRVRFVRERATDYEPARLCQTKLKGMPALSFAGCQRRQWRRAGPLYAACLSAVFSFSSLAFDIDVFSTRGLNGSSSAMTLSSVISFT